MTDSDIRFDNIATEYWRSYFEWRAQYGLSDDCMLELLAAIRVECDSKRIGAEDLQRLQMLMRLIETELNQERLGRVTKLQSVRHVFAA